jgi:hypothetical protein
VFILLKIGWPTLSTMRALSYLLLGQMILVCGCTSQKQVRVDYVRTTLPYEASVLVKGAERIRRDKPDISATSMDLVDQLIIEYALRLDICLSDPRISEEDKSYARDVLPRVVAYIARNNVGAGYELGKDYEMLPNDFMFPSKMKIRDVLDELIRDKK